MTQKEIVKSETKWYVSMYKEYVDYYNGNFSFAFGLLDKKDCEKIWSRILNEVDKKHYHFFGSCDDNGKIVEITIRKK